MTRTLVYEVKRWLIVYWLPSHAIAEAFPLIFGAYISILSLIRDLAVSDSLNQLGNETVFDQLMDEYDNFTVTAVTELADNYTVSVSNAVLWVCREGSLAASFYSSLYRMAIGCLITFHLITSFSRFFTARFWFDYKVSEQGDTTIIERDDDIDLGIRFITIVGAILLNLSFLLLLLSFDITPWSCISTPSTVDIEYISFSNRYDIQIDQTASAITFQKVASIISLVLAVSWLAVRITFFCHDVINDKVDERLENCHDVPDTGPAGHDKELLDVKENN